MKHEPPPAGRPDEPPFMAEFRHIERSIALQVGRYIAGRKLDFVRWFAAGTLGVWFGIASGELVKWWLK